jgi:hypothetical protein
MDSLSALTKQISCTPLTRRPQSSRDLLLVAHEELRKPSSSERSQKLQTSAAKRGKGANSRSAEKRRIDTKPGTEGSRDKRVVT